MDFGFTLKPEHSVERIIALTRQAEAAGFSYGWLRYPSDQLPESLTQFNIYLMSGDEETQLEAYGSTIIPALKAALDDA
jgi:hypothetical protein